MQKFLSRSQYRWIFFIIIAAALIRLLTLGVYPFADNTEARYAEVAREMVASGNWITPQLHGKKFWAKPPLSIWATAGSMKIFGDNEFAARLPHLIFSIIGLLLIFFLAKRVRGRDAAWASTAVLATTAAFFICSSAVMTDASLFLGTTLSMVAFWRALDPGGGSRRLWGYLFFLGQAIGFLAKGPVAVALTFLPIGLWMIWKKQWRSVWTGLPWGKGILLGAVIALPWFIAADVRTPGFLKYFFIGENLDRFLKPAWSGDMYGSAHIQPRGMIWLMWIMAAFPWSFFSLGAWLGKRKRGRRLFSALRNADAYRAYLIVWAAAPMLFFTLAGNILWTYVLPGLPAFALLLAEAWAVASGNNDHPVPRRRWVGVLSGLTVPVIFGGAIAIWVFLMPVKNSQKYLVSQYLKLRPGDTSRLVYFFERPYSAEFYTSGKALKINKLEPANVFFKDRAEDFFVIKKKWTKRLPAAFRTHLKPVATYGDYLLLREKGDASTNAGTAAYGKAARTDRPPSQPGGEI